MGMRQLQLNLEDILGPHGTIRGIARLLDRPKAAKYQLRTQINSLDDSAADCLKSAESIKDRLDKLLAFIMALSRPPRISIGDGKHKNDVGGGEEYPFMQAATSRALRAAAS
ncbi:hypothetical protein B0H67DRAFT_638787 [Lasiosphaeris hirsuta]|uniref:Uncharacterized protein n=1 Tax=Lasiosphaeris hirsuta TaxID=260670 RepID=A0AA40E9R2_9PEZI|nr:hypothetical protein B0H67DRAFT_638787 [Lasiosphaeris hirsuta]